MVAQSLGTRFPREGEERGGSLGGGRSEFIGKIHHLEIISFYTGIYGVACYRNLYSQLVFKPRLLNKRSKYDVV